MHRPLSFDASILVGVLCIAGCSGSGSGSAPPAEAAPKSSPMFYALKASTDSTSTPPAGVLGVQTLSLTFSGTGQTNAVLAYEEGYTGSFTLTSSCQNATGAPSGSAPAAATFAGSTTGTGPGAVLTVTAGATGGTCTFTVTDSSSSKAILFVGTSLTSGTVS